jgi:uncharacterized protein (TIGR02145 family)
MKKQNLLIYPLLLMGIFLVVANSCKKDGDNYNYNTFIDLRDGTNYKTVTIGNQVWMAENLKYLPSITGSESGSETTAYYYVYGYEGISVADAKASSNYNTYGVLYNWEAAKIACPDGWHLPKQAEWAELIDYLGGESVAGGKLKETGTNHWLSPNVGANNETGFTALPGGQRNPTGELFDIGKYGYWWSTTEFDYRYAWGRGMFYLDDDVITYNYFLKERGFSVRCVKD